MDRDNAHESLEIVQRAMEQTHKAVARAGTGYLFIIWGIVWLIGFMGSQFLGDLQGYLWMALDVFGIVGTAVVIVKSSRQVRTGQGKRIGVFWLMISIYGGLLYWITGPIEGNRYLLFITTLVAFAYVIMGLWFSPPLLYIGLCITALAIVGWQLIPAYLGIWLALVGGGGLIISGISVLRVRT